MNIDEIWKSFDSLDMQNVAINFEPTVQMWVITYDDHQCNKHIETDKDMTKAAQAMLKWYGESHTYKAAAELLWNALDEIADLMFKMSEASQDSEDIESVEESVAKIEKLLSYRNNVIRKIDGKLEWNKAYNDKNEHSLKDNEPASVVEESKKIQIPEKKEKVSPDEFPVYCMFNGDNLTVFQCWGVDDNDERIHVQLNYVDNSNTKIDKQPVNVNAEKIVEMNESEFENYYKEAEAMINALKNGYGIDDFSKYSIAY